MANTDLMIDLETLATSNDAAIVTMAAIRFDPHADYSKIKVEDLPPNQVMYKRIDLDSCTALGCKVNEETIKWWATQSKEAQDEAFGDHQRTGVMDAIKQLNKFSVGVDEFWCQGPLFDYAILQHLYKQMETPVPWNYWQIRDSRTVFNMMPQDPRKNMQTDLHNALADCYYQAKCLQKVYKHFGVKQK